jgi:dTDP-4-dehydrorhamnose reductase
MPRVLVLGSSGMAGHVLALSLKAMGSMTVMNAGPRKAVFEDTILCDLSTAQSIRAFLDSIRPDVVINCVGILTKAAEDDKLSAVWFNAYFPHLLSEWASRHGAKLVHISTDCVFSGNGGPYRVDSPRDGDLFYDRSKALGELDNGRDLTIRTSIIGPELSARGVGLFNWFMTQRGRVSGYRHVLWSGVTTIELARFIALVLERYRDASGLLQVSHSSGISKYDLLELIKREMGRSIAIEPSDVLRIDKRLIPCLGGLDFKVKDYEEQVRDMAAWIKGRSALYPHYLSPSIAGRIV